MIVLILIFVVFIGLIFLLRGEGDKYAGNTHKRGKNRIGLNDRNYFL